MPETRYVTVQFCDDIRQEVGNKYSLVGCYGPSMLLSAVPVVLSKLCAFVRIYTPVNRPFAKLSIRVLRGDQLLTEMEIPQEVLASIRAVEHMAGENVVIVGSGLAISPLARSLVRCALRSIRTKVRSKGISFASKGPQRRKAICAAFAPMLIGITKPLWAIAARRT